MSGAPAEPADSELSELFREHGDLIYSLGLRMCGSADAAEDLVQETFLRALRSWDTFEGRAKPSTWLYTIASRACSRMHRLKAGQPRHMEPLEQLLPSGEGGVIQFPADDDPEASAARRQATDAILVATEELPLDFRLPFVLKEIAGLSVSEIGEILGVKEATIKTRLHRARLRVRKHVVDTVAARRGPSGSPDMQREECLALLRAKQEAMDRDVEFPIPQAHLCERCRSVFQSLDYTHDVCRTLGLGEMPSELRQSLELALAQA